MMLIHTLEVLPNYSKYFLAIYDTTVSPYPYTGSENIDITDNRISLSSPLKVNGEVVLNPRAYDGAVFETSSGSDSFTFLKNTLHGGAPIAHFIHQRNHVHVMVIVRFQICTIKHL